MCKLIFGLATHMSASHRPVLVALTENGFKQPQRPKRATLITTSRFSFQCILWNLTLTLFPITLTRRSSTSVRSCALGKFLTINNVSLNMSANCNLLSFPLRTKAMPPSSVQAKRPNLEPTQLYLTVRVKPSMSLELKTY